MEWCLGVIYSKVRVGGPKCMHRCPFWEVTSFRKKCSRQNWYKKISNFITYSVKKLFFHSNQAIRSKKKTRQVLHPLYVLVCVAHSDWLIAASWISWEGKWELNGGWQSSLKELSFREFVTGKKDYQRSIRAWYLDTHVEKTTKSKYGFRHPVILATLYRSSIVF